MTSDASVEDEPRQHVLRRYVWNRTTLGAILLSSPAILSACGSLAMSQWIDRDIAALNQRRDMLVSTSSQLDTFKENVERYQLDRASLLLLLNGMNADANLKYALDKLFRLNAQDSMRRVAAILYPDEWKARMAPYEAITGSDYSEYEKIKQLQSMEDTMIEDAGHRLVSLQEQNNAVAARIDQQTSFRTAVLSIGNSLMYIISIMLFFIKTAGKDERHQA